jgi:O-antigen ligase
MKIRQPLTPFWLVGWSLAVAVAWLLPNHYPPWSTFHMDAWMAVVLLLLAAAIFVRSVAPVVLHGITLLTAMLVVVPGLQYGFGQIMSAGTAWVSTAYLVGFMLALLVGARWESASTGQLADGLFLAIGIAALVSVGLQLHQWFGLGLLDIWSMGDGYGRPFANFGQPNQLGTFLLWGLLATAWGLIRKKIGIWTTLLMAFYLLFGLALTQSRTVWVAVVMLISAGWIWRRLWLDSRGPWVVTALGLYFAICVLSIGWLSQLFLLPQTTNVGDIARVSGELRPAVWSLFIDASLQQPWFGYGWNQVASAQMTAALNHPALHIIFLHSHNLFLDLVLWCGIPMGVFVSFYLVRWVWQRLCMVGTPDDAVLLLFLLVVGNHAMLELPLHHAYFLFPTGLIMGALNVRLNVRPVLILGRWSAIGVWLASLILLSLLIRDYTRVEASYQVLRFEWAHIKTKIRGEPPEVLLLTQWRDFVRLARFEPTNGMSDERLDWMRKITITSPSTGFFHKTAAAMAMNQRPEEAKLWLKKLCKVSSESQCAIVKASWANQSQVNPAIAAVPWPN